MKYVHYYIGMGVALWLLSINSLSVVNAEAVSTQIRPYTIPPNDEEFNQQLLKVLGLDTNVSDIAGVLFGRNSDGSALIVWVVFQEGSIPQAKVFAVNIESNTEKLSTAEIELPETMKNVSFNNIFINDNFEVIGGVIGTNLWFINNVSVAIPSDGNWDIDAAKGMFFIENLETDSLSLASVDAPSEPLFQMATNKRKFQLIYCIEDKIYLLGSQPLHSSNSTQDGVCLVLVRAGDGAIKLFEEITVPRPKGAKGGYFNPLAMDPMAHGIVFLNRSESALTFGDLPMPGSGAYYFSLSSRKLRKLRNWPSGTIFVQKNLYESFIPRQFRKRPITIPK